MDSLNARLALLSSPLGFDSCQCLKRQSGTSSASCGSFIFVRTYFLLGNGEKKNLCHHLWKIGKISVKEAEMCQTWKHYSQAEGKVKSLFVRLWFDRVCTERNKTLFYKISTKEFCFILFLNTILFPLPYAHTHPTLAH